MPKVTKETIQALVEAHAYPPRHQQGCPKNYARMLPMLYAARGLSIDETVRKVREEYDKLDCRCDESAVITEW